MKTVFPKLFPRYVLLILVCFTSISCLDQGHNRESGNNIESRDSTTRTDTSINNSNNDSLPDTSQTPNDQKEQNPSSSSKASFLILGVFLGVLIGIRWKEQIVSKFIKRDNNKEDELESKLETTTDSNLDSTPSEKKGINRLVSTENKTSNDKNLNQENNLPIPNKEEQTPITESNTPIQNENTLADELNKQERESNPVNTSSSTFTSRPTNEEPEVTYQKFYLTMVPSNGEISVSSLRNEFIEGESLYIVKFTNGNTSTGTFELVKNQQNIGIALRFINERFDPICESINAYDDNFKSAITIESGEISKRGDGWVVSKKAQIKYIP